MAAREGKGSALRGRQSALRAATEWPRIVIEVRSPFVAGGAFPAKGVVGRQTEVTANIFIDGHPTLGAALLWKKADQSRWQQTEMVFEGNDLWRGGFQPDRPGHYHFLLEAWLSPWATYHDELAKKCAAGVVMPVEITEGRQQLEAALPRAKGKVAKLLQTALDKSADVGVASACEILLNDALTRVMKSVEERRFICRLERPHVVEIERRQAEFASWYELFPRSQTDDPRRHGTFDDVIARLPAIQAMGFDVLYFPPIHPIGETHRKGRNNSRTAAADDPGSPYAIGHREYGGHDAVHPELGGIEGFRRLREAAAAHGLELALDFAIQCSPDHPWLRDHPDWFDWRPDGSLRYAENPPKKYEDIVNVDFYTEGAVPDLWLALRDVVQYWIDEGVLIFRVDNPHTKPLPFWQWLIDDIRSRHPEAIFLAEAFTRPAMMYRLAQIGFNQSYTYFTWRHTKAELTDYLTELSTPPAADFYRPNFFVNTPDINPYFLHTSGRGGFIIRATLAATLSGLWGVYSGFELCESAPVPGKEEYLDSEKYEVRPRDWQAPGNIIDVISTLNRLRREHPALQSHLGVRFHNAINDQVLYFSKRAAGTDDVLLIAVSLDPQTPQETLFDLPLEELGLAENMALDVHELMGGGRFTWYGRTQHWWFNPADMPVAIWQVTPQGGIA